MAVHCFFFLFFLFFFCFIVREFVATNRRQSTVKNVWNAWDERERDIFPRVLFLDKFLGKRAAARDNVRVPSLCPRVKLFSIFHVSIPNGNWSEVTNVRLRSRAYRARCDPINPNPFHGWISIVSFFNNTLTLSWNNNVSLLLLLIYKFIGLIQEYKYTWKSNILSIITRTDKQSERRMERVTVIARTSEVE